MLQTQTASNSSSVDFTTIDSTYNVYIFTYIGVGPQDEIAGGSKGVSFQGSVDGDVECKDLIVGKSGNIKGKINTESLSVEGTVEGELNIKGLLKLMSSGSVSGKITYGSLQINEGGKLIGEIDFKDKNILQEEFKDFKAL